MRGGGGMVAKPLVPPAGPEPVMRVTAVTKRYGERTVLDVERLDVLKGEVLALMGPSGSGKTTLLRILATLETPTTGQVSLDGAAWGPPNGAAGPVSPARLLAWRRRVTYVGQNPVLFSGTVFDNVNLPLAIRCRVGPGARAAVEEMLERVGLAALAAARTASLSAGEAQRVALARALVSRPDVLLLDEPTANLDPANVAVIEKTLIEAVEMWRPAVVLVTHNLFQARRLGRRTGLIVGGRLIELGETEAVFSYPQDARTASFVKGEMVF